MVEGIATGRRVKHHRQGFPPSAQTHPIEIVDRLARLDALHQQIDATPRRAQGEEGRGGLPGELGGFGLRW